MTERWRDGRAQGLKYSSRRIIRFRPSCQSNSRFLPRGFLFDLGKNNLTPLYWQLSQKTILDIFFLSATIKIVRVINCLRHRRTSVFQPVRSGPIRANARTRRLGWINSGPYNRFVAGWIINLYNTYLTVFIPYLLYFSNKALLQ